MARRLAWFYSEPMRKTNDSKPDTKKPKRIRLSPSIPPMPPDRAFVVQFRGGPKSGPAWFGGRVEHLLSGTSTEFATVQTLAEFFKRVLKQVPRAEPEMKRRK